MTSPQKGHGLDVLSALIGYGVHEVHSQCFFFSAKMETYDGVGTSEGDYRLDQRSCKAESYQMQDAHSMIGHQHMHRVSSHRYENEGCSSSASRRHGAIKPSHSKQPASYYTAAKFRRPSAGVGMTNPMKGPSAYYTVQNQHPLNLAQVR